jgi:PEP-CTERM motif
MRVIRTSWETSFFAVCVLLVGTSAHATSLTIGTWANANSANNANGSVSGSGGSATITINGGTSSVSSDVPFSPQTLNVGDNITLTGNVSAIQSNIGNVQFRFALFNGSNYTTDLGFSGYIGEVPNTSPTGGVLAGLNPSSSSSWQSGANHYSATGVNQTGHTTNGGANTSSGPTYNLTLSLTLTSAGNYSILASYIAADDATNSDFNWTATGTDATTGGTSSAPNTSFNGFGLFWGGGSSLSSTSPNNVITLSNFAVTYTPAPEPSALVLAGLGLIGLVSVVRKKK